MSSTGLIGPDTLRLVDRLLGVPACAALSVGRRVARFFRRRSAPIAHAPQRVLFVQLAESGSMVIADPAMRALAARTGAQCHCVTFALNRPSLAITGTVADSNVFAIRTGSARELLVDAWRFLRWVRRMQIDTVVDFELFSRLSAVLCLATGVARRAGFHRFGGDGLYRGDLYTDPVAFNPRLHMAQNYQMLVEAVLGTTTAPAPAPHLAVAALSPVVHPRTIAATELAAVRTRLAHALQAPLAGTRLVLVNANASAMLPQRRWPEAHFVELIEALIARGADVRVLLIGAADDRATTAAIAAQVANPRCVDGAGLFPLAHLPALFSVAAVMVSNDSGPAHFASVTALPVIVLFGPETPALFRPLGNATVISANLACSPCVNAGNQRRTRCTDNQCMKRISVAEVVAATSAVLDAEARPARRPRREALAA